MYAFPDSKNISLLVLARIITPLRAEFLKTRAIFWNCVLVELKTAL